MTTEEPSNQARQPARAIWLARLPAGQPGDERHHDRRSQATALARSGGADIVGEFLVSASDEEGLPGHVWVEVLDFTRHLMADVLVVLAPRFIAQGFTDYYRRTQELEAASVRLVLPEVAAFSSPETIVRDEKEAA